MAKYDMEIIHHNLSCNCHRRREWINVNGEMTPIEFSVDDPNKPPMTEEEKEKIAMIMMQHLESKNK